MQMKRPRSDSVAQDDDQMCATDSRQVYGLNDKDLSKLVCENAPNPYDRNAAPMRLYRVRDLRVSVLV
jgi:hypothetical protein